jgi:hypothetical protein
MKRIVLTFLITVFAFGSISGCARDRNEASGALVQSASTGAKSKRKNPTPKATPSEGALPRPAERTAAKSPKITILAPRPGEWVPQFGESVRFRLEGELPAGTQPVIFIRDGTGLDTNWWVYRPRRDFLAGRDDWICGVQYGESRDGGRKFAVVVMILEEATCPSQGVVGPLPNPDDARAISGIVEVVRQ